MTSINDILFPLLRNGLYEDRAPEMIPQLSAGQWDELLETAQQQTVAGIMYHGLSRLGTAYAVPTDVTFRLVAEANRIEQESKRKEAVAWQEFQRMFVSVSTALSRTEGMPTCRKLSRNALTSGCGKNPMTIISSPLKFFILNVAGRQSQLAIMEPYRVVNNATAIAGPIFDESSML